MGNTLHTVTVCDHDSDTCRTYSGHTLSALVTRVLLTEFNLTLDDFDALEAADEYDIAEGRVDIGLPFEIVDCYLWPSVGRLRTALDPFASVELLAGEA